MWDPYGLYNVNELSTWSMTPTIFLLITCYVNKQVVQELCVQERELFVLRAFLVAVPYIVYQSSVRHLPTGSLEVTAMLFNAYAHKSKPPITAGNVTFAMKGWLNGIPSHRRILFPTVSRIDTASQAVRRSDSLK